MERYQLRLKSDQSLQDVLDELVDIVWRILSQRLAQQKIREEEKESLRVGIQAVFSRFIVRFDTCGLQSICEESIEPSEWNLFPEPELRPRHPWQSEEVKRLVLVVEEKLEEFVNALEAEIFKDIFATPERAHLAKALRPELGQAIRESLGPHLYRNLACGISELCRVAAPMDPWK